MANAPAVLFDIDGTLIDSNYLHVHAWCRAFDDVGIAVESWRIHRSIGMDGKRLLNSLSGDADENTQQRAKDLHLQYLKETAPLLRPLPGARELLERVRALGLQVVLASSASEEELSLSRDCPRHRRPRVGRDVVEGCRCRQARAEHHRGRAGPSGSRRRQCRLRRRRGVGRRRLPQGGVTSIGLLSGGVSREELENAGAEAVFDNPA